MNDIYTVDMDDILNGIYDNQESQLRESWMDGQIEMLMSKNLIDRVIAKGGKLQPFGTYPERQAGAGEE